MIERAAPFCQTSDLNNIDFRMFTSANPIDKFRQKEKLNKVNFYTEDSSNTNRSQTRGKTSQSPRSIERKQTRYPPNRPDFNPNNKYIN